MSRPRLSAKGPSIAEVCRWARIDDSTRTGWARMGLVRHLDKDSSIDLGTAIETVVAAGLTEHLTIDDALMAWTAVGETVMGLESPPPHDRLDLIWFPSAPGD